MSAGSDDRLTVLLDLIATTRGLTRKIDRVLGESHGIGIADLELLLQLQRAPDARLTLAELATALGVASSEVVRQLAPLERIGVVERSRHPSDPRQGEAVLTEAGDELTGFAVATAGDVLTNVPDEMWPHFH